MGECYLGLGRRLSKHSQLSDVTNPLPWDEKCTLGDRSVCLLSRSPWAVELLFHLEDWMPS